MSEQIPTVPFLLSSEAFNITRLRNLENLVGHYQINLRESEVNKLHKGEMVTFQVYTDLPVFAACEISDKVKGVKTGIQWPRALSTDSDKGAQSQIVLAGNQAIVTGWTGSRTYYVISESAIRMNSLYHSFRTGIDQLEEGEPSGPRITAQELIQSGIWSQSDPDQLDLCSQIIDLMSSSSVSSSSAAQVKIARSQYMEQVNHSINWVLRRVNDVAAYARITLRLKQVRRRALFALEVFVDLARKYPYLPVVYDNNRDEVGFATIFRKHPVKFSDAHVFTDAVWTQFSARFELNHLKWQQLNSVCSARESDLRETQSDNLDRMEECLASGGMGNSDIDELLEGAEIILEQRQRVKEAYDDMEAKCEIMGESAAISHVEAVYVLHDLIGLAKVHPKFDELFPEDN
jgi:hypothetical protein